MPLADLVCLVRAVAADGDVWRHRVRIPGIGAERWWTCLAADDRVDVWLLSWLPGHSTTPHDHGTSAAAFTVVRGRLSEVRLDEHGRRRVRSWRPGSLTWLAPGVIHDVHGAGTQPSVSIHAYSPPLRDMTYYERWPAR